MWQGAQAGQSSSSSAKMCLAILFGRHVTSKAKWCDRSAAVEQSVLTRLGVLVSLPPLCDAALLVIFFLQC